MESTNERQTKVPCNSHIYSGPTTLYIPGVKKSHISKVFRTLSCMQSQEQPRHGKLALQDI